MPPHLGIRFAADVCCRSVDRWKRVSNCEWPQQTQHLIPFADHHLPIRSTCLPMRSINRPVNAKSADPRLWRRGEKQNRDRLTSHHILLCCVFGSLNRVKVNHWHVIDDGLWVRRRGQSNCAAIMFVQRLVCDSNAAATIITTTNHHRSARRWNMQINTRSIWFVAHSQSSSTCKSTTTTLRQVPLEIPAQFQCKPFHAMFNIHHNQLLTNVTN